MAATLRSDADAGLFSSVFKHSRACWTLCRSSPNAFTQLFNARIVLDRLTDFSSSRFTSPSRIRTSRYRCHSSLSKMTTCIFSTLASNQPCRFGLTCSGSGSVKTPNKEFAAASTQISIFSPPVDESIRGTRVLEKFGSQIEPVVIPCRAIPSESNTSPSPEKSSSAAMDFPAQLSGISPCR